MRGDTLLCPGLQGGELGFGAADQTRVGLTPKRVLLTPSFQTFHILPNRGKEMETLIEIPYKDREREGKSQARTASQPINTEESVSLGTLQINIFSQTPRDDNGATSF